jgi:DNA-binding transcriptional MerR regulator
VEKVRYMISDAANIAGVESHVLRYWEDELELDIPRNEMGHRYYTKENIQQFQRIKELKEQGYQLKSIRMILHNNGVDPQTVTKEEPPAAAKEERPVVTGERRPAVTGEGHPAEPEKGLSAEERMAQFRELMSDIVGRAIAQNNEELSQSIGVEVQERVLKEMNYLMREQEDAAEERYKKLDAVIRGELKKRRFLFAKKETEKSSSGTKKKARPVEQGT